MDDKKATKEFLEGFREGMDSAFNEVVSMLSRGYKVSELKIMVGTRRAAIHKEIDQEMRKQGLIDVPKKRTGGIPTIKRGESIIFLEKDRTASLAYITELRENGSDPLAIVRMNPKKLVKIIGEGVAVRWLSTSTKSQKSHITPPPVGLAISIDNYDGSTPSDDMYIKPGNFIQIDLDISKHIKDVESPVIYIEGLEYIITQTDFARTLKMIQAIREKIIMNDAMLVLTIDVDSVEERQLNLIKNEMTYKYKVE